MKVCSKCKHTEPDSSAYCTRCGTAVGFFKIENPEYSTLARSDVFVHPKKRKIKTNTAGVVFISFVAFLVISFIFVCVVTGLSSSSTQNFNSQSSSFNIDAIDNLIKTKAKSNNLNIIKTQYYSSEELYIISVMPDDGFAQAAALVPSNAKLESDWKYMRSNVCSFCSSCYDLIKDFTGQSIYVQINILNDVSPDKVLLSVLNGTVIFDCTEE